MILSFGSQRSLVPVLATLLASGSTACSIDTRATQGTTDPAGTHDASPGDDPGDTGNGAADAAVDPEGQDASLLDGSPAPVEGDAGAEPFDPGSLTIDVEGASDLCRLSANHKKLLVRVRNGGRQRSPRTELEVRTKDTSSVVRVAVPAIEPGTALDLSVDRAELLGFRERWAFELLLDPDAALGLPGTRLEGECLSARARVELAAQKLLDTYDQSSGTWGGTWWHSARMLGTLVRYTRHTGDSTPMSLLGSTFELQGGGGFLSESFDDEGYWALTWLHAHELTHRQRYLDNARALFGDMTSAYSGSCGGGLFRGKQPGAKYASTNALMMMLSARLALYAGNEADRKAFLSWAEGAWAWFQSTGMLGEDHQVFDSLDASCAPTGPLYTGNHGLLIGGLIELAQASGNDALLDRAEAIAQRVLATMTDTQGVLLETACDPSCGEGDVTLYKGMFVEQLARLLRLRPHAVYQTFLLRQSDVLWAESRDETHQFGQNWQGPFDRADSRRQASAVDALIAAVRAEQPNVALGVSASGSAPCIEFESPWQVVDGSSRFDSKWCSYGSSGQTLDLDLGELFGIVGFRVRHAGHGGEDPGWNTRDFRLLASADGQNFETLVQVTDNVESVTTHPVAPHDARYVRLVVDEAQTREDAQAARIYELEVFGLVLP